MIRHGDAGMNRTARSVEGVVDEVESAPAGKARLGGDRDLHFAGEGPWVLLARAQERQVVGLAHIEVQVDRVDGNERGEHGGRARAGAATRDEVSGGDEVRADPAGEWCRDTSVIE